MQEEMELFIKYTHDSEPTPEGRIARLEQLLRDIAKGTWVFPAEFQVVGNEMLTDRIKSLI